MSGQAPPEQSFPWAAAMRFGLGRLRLSPEQFWSMTPLELAAAIEGFMGSEMPSLSRSMLKDLMRQYPDNLDS